MRVIDEKGDMLGILPTHEAMGRADEAGLQLVEVNPKASPPVCKIMDYGKFKYETSKRDREAKKHTKTSELKEVKYRPKTHDHDFEFKTKHARRFIEDGDKVKLVVQFRGREITHPETGRSILDRVCVALADVATVLQMPNMEGNRMNMVLAPKIRRETQRPSKPRPTLGTSGEIGSRGPRSTSAKPAGAKPAEAKPAETKPAETKPAEAKSDAEAKPAVASAD